MYRYKDTRITCAKRIEVLFENFREVGSWFRAEMVQQAEPAVAVWQFEQFVFAAERLAWSRFGSVCPKNRVVGLHGQGKMK